MSSVSPIERARRAFAFARHVPLAKILRRVELDVRRRANGRLPMSSSVLLAPIARAPGRPAPIFAPRFGHAPEARDLGWSFAFLNRKVAMPGSRIDWMAPGTGADHQLWRMNLHQMEYLESVDDTLWARLVDDWIGANSPARPWAWRDSWNSYALSLRVVVWLQELARRAGQLPEEVVRRVEASVGAQLCFLEQNLETDLGGNHLMKNIKALLWGSSYFSGPEPARWRRLGLKLLRRELSRQILLDGVHYERSPSYHCQVFADLLECRHALNNDPLHGGLDDALRRMAQVVADLSHPDGRVALFNDAGLTMAYSPGECLDVYVRLYGRRPSPQAVFAYPEAGYFGLRARRSFLVADCGRIAPDDLPAHGHGDVLSFEWSVDGARIIVDQGVFEYVAGARRQASRAAASHNTLAVDGTDQADFFSSFRCGRRPNVDVRVWQPCTDRFVLEGSHDGFQNLSGRPRHVRRFEVAPGGLTIRDCIKGLTARHGRIGFLLHPEVRVVGADRSFELQRGASRIAMKASLCAGVEPAVWWPDMGHEQATQRIVIAVPPGTREVRTSFLIVPQGEHT